MAIDRADVIEAELLEHRGRHDHTLGMFFEALGQFEHRAGQDRLADIFCRRIELARHQARKVAIQGTDRRRDRHVVVVQHHQQVDVIVHAGIVHGFESHAGGHRSVADDGNGVAVFALDLGGQGHAECGGNRGRGMRGAEGVVRTLAAAREARDAILLAQHGHLVAPAGEYLVRISLVADVPHDAIFRRVEHVVQRNGQLDRAEIGRQVAAGLRHGIEHVLAQLVCQLLQLRA